MDRRRFLALTGALGLTGCLRLEANGREDLPAEDQSAALDGGGRQSPEGTEPTKSPQSSPLKQSEAAVTDHPIQILTDYRNDPWQTIWEDSIATDFETNAGIPVEVQYAGNEAGDRLTRLVASGSPPESFTGRLNQIVSALADDELLSVTETVRSIEEQVGDTVVTQPRLKGERYVIPHGVYVSTIHYRSDILERLGLEPPETWTELRRTARAIEEDGEIDARGFVVPASRTSQSSACFSLFFLANGGWFTRWNSDGTEAEFWFPEDRAIETLEFLDQLAEYSIDPAGINWSSSLSNWASGRSAMTYLLNGWGAGAAANAGVGPIADGTGIVPAPRRGSVEPMGRTRVSVDGHTVLSGADNVGGALELLKFMYSNPDVAATYYLAHPGRFVPAYSDVLFSRGFQDADLHRSYPNVLRLTRESVDIMDSHAPSERDTPRTQATIYADQTQVLTDMVYDAIAGGKTAADAVGLARSRYESVLAEGRGL